MRRIRKAVAGFPDAAMFALREEGYGSVFQQLVACIISVRTTDEVSLPTALALLKRAPTPAKMLRLEVAEINRLLVPFGKHVCTGVRPKCSVCPVLEYCRQLGVTEHRGLIVAAAIPNLRETPLLTNVTIVFTI